MQSMCPVCHHSQRTVLDEYLRAGRDLLCGWTAPQAQEGTAPEGDKYWDF
jgi:hypothetical protein